MHLVSFYYKNITFIIQINNSKHVQYWNPFKVFYLSDLISGTSSFKRPDRRFIYILKTTQSTPVISIAPSHKQCIFTIPKMISWYSEGILYEIKFCELYYNEDRQSTYNVILGCVLVTIIFYIFWVCVCSLRYRACNMPAPYCHLWPDPLYNIFPHCTIKSTIFEKKLFFFSIIY